MPRCRSAVTVNGVKHDAVVEPRTLLVYFLREHLGLTGTHVGCDTSQCGACTVHLDGRAVKSCTVLAVASQRRRDQNHRRPGRRRYFSSGAGRLSARKHGLQCGYCTPGMIMTAVHLLETNLEPDRRRDQARARRQYLPLHRLRQYRRVGQMGSGQDGRQKCFR